MVQNNWVDEYLFEKKKKKENVPSEIKWEELC